MELDFNPAEINPRTARIFLPYPKIIEKDCGKFNLYRYCTPEGFIVLSYLVDLKDPESREKFANCLLTMGYYPGAFVGAKEQQKEKRIFDLLEEYKLIRVDSSKTERIDEIFSEISGIEEARLKGYLKDIVDVRIPEAKQEIGMYSENIIKGMRELAEEKSRILGIEDVPSFIEVLMQEDLTSSVLGLDKFFFPYPFLDKSRIPEDERDRYQWRIDLAKKAKFLKFEKIEEQEQVIGIIYRPVLNSGTRDEFNIPLNANLDLLLQESN